MVLSDAGFNSATHPFIGFWCTVWAASTCSSWNVRRWRISCENICIYMFLISDSDQRRWKERKNERKKHVVELLMQAFNQLICWLILSDDIGSSQIFPYQQIYFFWGGGGLKNIVQEMMLGVICNYCIYYIWSESVSVPAPASIG